MSKKKANFFNVGNGGGGYLLDNYSPDAAYSIARRLSAAHTNPMTIRNGITNNTLLCQWDSNDELDITHIENWLGSDYATVDVIYDASGNDRHLNAVGDGGNIATGGVVNVTAGGYPYIQNSTGGVNNFVSDAFSITGGNMDIFLMVVGTNRAPNNTSNNVLSFAPYDGQDGSGVRRIPTLVNETTKHAVRTFNGYAIYKDSVYGGTNYKLDTVYFISGESVFKAKVNGVSLELEANNISNIELNTSSRVQVFNTTSSNVTTDGEFSEGFVFLTDIETQLTDLESDITTYYNL